MDSLVSKNIELKERLEKAEQIITDLCWQFGYEAGSHEAPAISTGGLSDLETAFEFLEWDDPHKI